MSPMSQLGRPVQLTGSARSAATGDGNPAGGGVMAATWRATDGPLFVTVTVQVIDVPATTVPAGPVIWIERSAPGCTATSDVAVELAAFGSAVGDVAVAVVATVGSA